MKLSRDIYTLTRKLVMPIAAGMLAVSCVNDNSLCIEDGPGYNPNDNVYLSLYISNPRMTGDGNPSSRAGDLSDIHAEETATAAENYINPNDISLNIFDERGNAIKTLRSSEFTLTTVGNNNSQYRIVTKINRGYLNLIGSSGKLSVLAVANTKGINRNDLTVADYDNVAFMKSLDDLTGELRSYGYDGRLLAEGSDPWTPNIDAGRHIPMAGYEITTIDPTALDNATTEAKAVQLNNITMQRAMAKIRVLDGVTFQTGLSSQTVISSVKFCSGAIRAAYVPSTTQITAWRNGTATTERATVPATAGQWNSAELAQPTFTGTFKTTDASGVTRDFPSFTCYAPETAVRSLKSTPVRPYLEIITAKRKADGSYHNDKKWEVYLDEWLANVTETPDVARNHIYQFIVTASEKAKLNIQYTVCEWRSATSGNITFN